MKVIIIFPKRCYIIIIRAFWLEDGNALQFIKTSRRKAVPMLTQTSALNQLAELSEILHICSCDGNNLISVSWDTTKHILIAQLYQRFPDRSLADAEFFREQDLAYNIPGLVHTLNNILEYLIMDDLL